MRKLVLLAAVLFACTASGCTKKTAQDSSAPDQTLISTAETQTAETAVTTTETAVSAASGTTTDAAETERTELSAADGSDAPGDPDTPDAPETEEAGAEASAEETPIGDGPTIGFEKDIYASAGQEHVPVTVHFFNNPGFCVVGLRLRFGGDIAPVLLTEDHAAEYELGEAGTGLLASCTGSAEKHAGAFVGMTTTPCTESGALYTCYFDIPADLRAGTKIPLKIEITDLADNTGRDLTAEVRNAYIIIE